MVIVSKQNPIVKELASLKDKKGRREYGAFAVEGGKMVVECAESGLEIVRIALREDVEPSAFAHLAPEIAILGKDAFRAVSDEKTPQGVLAEVRIPRADPHPPTGDCLLLDGVSDPSNVGAIVRTAVAAGFCELYLADCADPFSPKSVRASMSGVFHAELMRGTREDLLGLLGGVPLVAADMGGEDLFSFVPPEKVCLAIGNEGNGLSDAVRRRADFTVGIPMGEHTESLNAAVSAGILMYLMKKNRI